MSTRYRILEGEQRRTITAPELAAEASRRGARVTAITEAGK